MTLTARELSLLSNTNVLGYIQERNAKRDAQAKAEGWTFWTLMAESIAPDFANAYELEHSFAWGAYSDIHKEEYCYRPDVDLSDATLEEIESLIAAIC